MRTFAVVSLLLLGTSSAWPALPPVQSPQIPAMTASVPSGQAAPAASSSLDNVCNTLLTSAQDNALPVPFFANLIWQESKLRKDVVSPAGAEGIAQFMPKVAAQSGLANPFDPAQALPASAKMLRHLYDRFGNLGYVAAAYNAGPRRVLDWVEHGRTLPLETRKYVMTITGRSIEDWRVKPNDTADLHFARALPCSALPTYAALVQTQSASQPAVQASSQQAPQPDASAPAAKLDVEHARLVKSDHSKG